MLKNKTNKRDIFKICLFSKICKLSGRFQYIFLCLVLIGELVLCTTESSSSNSSGPATQIKLYLYKTNVIYHFSIITFSSAAALNLSLIYLSQRGSQEKRREKGSKREKNKIFIAIIFLVLNEC